MVAGGCGGPAGQALAQAFAQASAAGRGAAVAEAIAQADATAAQEVRRGTHCQSHPTADHNMHICFVPDTCHRLLLLMTTASACM